MNLTQAVIAIANFVGDGLGRTIARIDALESNQIDAETKKRIMRCVHAWEKTVDTDNDAGNSGADASNTSNTGVYGINVSSFSESTSRHIIAFVLTKNGSPISWDDASYTIKSGDKRLSTFIMSSQLYYSGSKFKDYTLSVVHEGVTITKTYKVIDGKLVEVT